MVAVRSIALLVTLTAIIVPPSSGRPRSGSAGTLFSQSAAEALNRDFPNSDISYLLLDANTDQVLTSRWERPDVPVPLGSLVKPFVALAYGEQHGFVYPLHKCRGVASGCWRPGGHGDVDLTAGIAYSCNSYFRVLTADLSASDVLATTTRFGIEPPDRGASGEALAGIGAQWRISPLRMARAYVELTRRRHDVSVMPILEGMVRSARRGTGAAVDRALRTHIALVKTGTAPCAHSPHSPGDGFTVALTPADDPKILLMVRVHGVPGSQAARIAGQMLRRIED